MDDVLAAMSRIDTRTAQASSKHDERMIREAVRASDGGFGAVNRLIHQQLRFWLEKHASSRVDAVETPLADDDDDDHLVGSGEARPLQVEQTLQLCDALRVHASLLRELGSIDDVLRGEELCSRALERLARVRMLDGHPLWLACQHEMGLLLHARGRYRDAAAHLQRAMLGRFGALRRRHKDTLASMRALGATLLRCDEVAAAEAVLRQALRHMRELADDADSTPDALHAMVALAHALRLRAEFSEAEQLLSDALPTCRAALGATHPITLDAMDEYAAVLMHYGDALQAQRMRRELQRARHELLGEAHPATVAADEHVVSELQREGRLADAARECEACLARYSAALGAQHPVASACALRAALLLMHSSAATKAFRPKVAALRRAGELMRSALAAQCVALGDAHADTRAVMEGQKVWLVHVLDESSNIYYWRDMHRDMCAMMEGATEALGCAHEHALHLKLQCARELLYRGPILCFGSAEHAAQFRQGEELMRDVLRIYGDKYGPQHSKTVQLESELIDRLLFSCTCCGPLRTMTVEREASRGRRRSGGNGGPAGNLELMK